MAVYEQIEKANNSLAFIELERINKDGSISKRKYVEVNQRIKGFRMVHPNGRIETEIVSFENDEIVMQAKVFDGDGKLISTGFARETASDDFLKVNYLEVCETSCIGRALGFAGFGIDTSLSSYEEVVNAIEKEEKKPEEKPKPEKKKRNVPMAKKEQLEIIKNLDDSLKGWVLDKFKLDSLDDLSEEEADWFIDELKKKGVIADGEEVEKMANRQ